MRARVETPHRKPGNCLIRALCSLYTTPFQGVLTMAPIDWSGKKDPEPPSHSLVWVDAKELKLSHHNMDIHQIILWFLDYGDLI